MSEEQELGVLRDQIDALDQNIQKLINERAKCAQNVAHVKEKYSNGEAIKFYRPEREAQVLRKVMDRNEGPIANEDMARLFREVMSICLALEEPLKVAFLGPDGTFTQAAALKHFGHSVQCESQVSIADVFREVAAGSVNYGVVPVENSTEGVVTHTLDSFAESSLQICGEVALRIHHHFLSNESNDQIQKVYSHPQSLAQCRQWLDTHWPNIERIAVSSNAEAAKRAAKEPNAAAIAGDAAAQLYAISALANNIEDMPDNTTRFLIIGVDKTQSCGDDKTSIMVSSRNQPGALYHVLEPFHKAGVSLTRIETRPSRSGAWNYNFFIDFEGHFEDEGIQAVLEKVGAAASDLKILGSYPKAVL
ncbi:prephenate dehydratase [Bermanella sp. WJH001]|uniref:prephenate dehydratase n=1 Tax=Bermanella sp. WJH001 TaxID=3048005 RepID=UPI0024BD9F3D|nr:prephenate dehydratase [Bermanella sp. WJH001]MDJ1536765.1 prephenate dehydratase [Bermanella sp. WJH001]